MGSVPAHMASFSDSVFRGFEPCVLSGKVGAGKNGWLVRSVGVFLLIGSFLARKVSQAVRANAVDVAVSRPMILGVRCRPIRT
jgi:hypothetical protein